MGFETGKVVDGRYELLEVLGEGGFGVVYKARQRSTGQFVAIKILLVDTSIDDEATKIAVGRFEREMKVIGRLRHPNIVKLLDSGQLESGELFIALEFVDGAPLHLVARREGGLDIVEATHLMMQVLEALAVAHEAGIIHRDLKPHNTMVTSGGLRRNALVLDFGVAGIEEHAREEGDAELTADHAVTGSPAYMAPEQIGSAPVSPRMDIYSWGLCFVEALTGKRAVPGDDAFQVMLKQVSKDPVDIPISVHPRLRRILQRALAKDPIARYQTVAEALTDLQDFDPHDTSAEVTIDTTADQEVREVLAQAAAMDKSTFDAPSKSNAKWLVLVAVLVLGGVVAWFALGGSETDSGSTDSAGNASGEGSEETDESAETIDGSSIAVLPFANLSPDPENAYFGDGLADELINALAGVDGLEVTPRTTSFAFRDSKKAITDIAAELKVASVLEGSVRKAGDRLKITVALVDGVSGKQIWTESWDRTLDDVFAIQEEIAQAIVRRLEVELVGSDAPLIAQQTESTEAYNLYLKGRFYWNKRNPDAANEAIKYLEEAIRLEPDYALAWSAVADMYVIMAWFSWIDADIGYPKAEQAIARALELDPDMGQLYASLAVARLWYHYDWEGAEDAYLKAHEMTPDFATARQWYGSMLLVPLGRFDEARTQLAVARELDPISPIIQTDSADIDYYAGDSAKAAAGFLPALEMHPEFFMGPYSLGRALVQQGEEAAAIGALEKARELSSDSAVVLASLGYAYGVFGRDAEAREILALFDERSSSEHVQAAFYARVYAGMGDVDKAFEYLDKAVDDHSGHIPYLKTDPAFAQLADDPRFDALLDRIGVTAWEAAHPDKAQPRPRHPKPHR